MSKTYGNTYKNAFFCLFLAFFLCRCDDGPDAQLIVDKAIERHGGNIFNHSEVAFDFREYHYARSREEGLYRYERMRTDSAGNKLHDILTNERFVRMINGDTVDLPADSASAFSSSLNSVIYFALLPYRLNDEAVKKQYLGESIIKGEKYHKIRVSFAQEGGGEDHEDSFIYWFHTQDYTMDYLAYHYHVNEGGVRFREAYNVREKGGIRFADYYNFEGKLDEELAAHDTLFEQGKLDTLSQIRLENIEVNPSL